MLLRPRMGAVVLQPPLLKVIPTLISTRPDRLVAHPWTTTVNQGCPAARIGTYFFHRHDQVRLSQQLWIASFPLNYRQSETTR
jgi:hypothetical protein